jgi:hypothetical protein
MQANEAHDRAMTDAGEAWADVGDRLSALSLKLKLHAGEELSERKTEPDDGWARMRWAIEEVLEALGDAAQDPAVRADVCELTDAIVDAAKMSADELRSGLANRA